MKKSELVSQIQSNAQKIYMDLPVDEKDVIRRFNGTDEARILRKVFPEIAGGLARLRGPEGVSTRRRGLATR